MKRRVSSILIFGPRLVAMVSALTMTQGLPVQGQQGYDLGNLKEIERYIDSRDCAGLQSYVELHPHLLRGGDPLSQELGRFVQRMQTGPMDCFAAGPAQPGPRKTTLRRGLFGIRLPEAPPPRTKPY